MVRVSFRKLVGDVETEHPGRAACVDLSRFAVHCLNLSLTAILIRIYRIVKEKKKGKSGKMY